MKKIKYIVAAGVAVLIILGSDMTSSADQGWNRDDKGWWYEYDDGSYAKNAWKWIGGQKYYFNANGYMLENTITPDGKTVNGDGAWIVDGIVQTDNYNPDYPLKDMLGELHLELSDLYTFKESKTNGNTNTWAAYNESVKGQITERFSFYVARLSGEIDNFERAGIYQDEMEASYQVMKEFLNSFDWRNASDRSKAEKAAQLVCKSNYISNRAASIYRPYGCLVNKEAVCDGMAYTFAYLTRMMGMESFYDPNSGHALNVVKVDGNWYRFDGSASNANTGNSYCVFAPASVTIEDGIAKINSYNINDSAAFSIQIR